MCSHVQSEVLCIEKEKTGTLSLFLSLFLPLSSTGLLHLISIFTHVNNNATCSLRNLRFLNLSPFVQTARLRVSTERKPRRKRRNARRPNSMKSTASCDSLIKGERRDKMSTVPYPPPAFSFKEASRPLYKACDGKRALISRTETRRRGTQEEKREEGRGKGGGGEEEEAP